MKFLFVIAVVVALAMAANSVDKIILADDFLSFVPTIETDGDYGYNHGAACTGLKKHTIPATYAADTVVEFPRLNTPIAAGEHHICGATGAGVDTELPSIGTFTVPAASTYAIKTGSTTDFTVTVPTAATATLVYKYALVEPVEDSIYAPSCGSDVSTYTDATLTGTTFDITGVTATKYLCVASVDTTTEGAHITYINGLGYVTPLTAPVVSGVTITDAGTATAVAATVSFTTFDMFQTDLVYYLQETSASPTCDAAGVTGLTALVNGAVSMDNSKTYQICAFAATAAKYHVLTLGKIPTYAAAAGTDPITWDADKETTTFTFADGNNDMFVTAGLDKYTVASNKITVPGFFYTNTAGETENVPLTTMVGDVPFTQNVEFTVPELTQDGTKYTFKNLPSTITKAVLSIPAGYVDKALIATESVDLTIDGSAFTVAKTAIVGTNVAASKHLYVPVGSSVDITLGGISIIDLGLTLMTDFNIVQASYNETSNKFDATIGTHYTTTALTASAGHVVKAPINLTGLNDIITAATTDLALTVTVPTDFTVEAPDVLGDCVVTEGVVAINAACATALSTSTDGQFDFTVKGVVAVDGDVAVTFKLTDGADPAVVLDTVDVTVAVISDTITVDATVDLENSLLSLTLDPEMTTGEITFSALSVKTADVEATEMTISKDDSVVYVSIGDTVSELPKDDTLTMTIDADATTAARFAGVTKYTVTLAEGTVDNGGDGNGDGDGNGEDSNTVIIVVVVVVVIVAAVGVFFMLSKKKSSTSV